MDCKLRLYKNNSRDTSKFEGLTRSNFRVT